MGKKNRKEEAIPAYEAAWETLRAGILEELVWHAWLEPGKPGQMAKEDWAPGFYIKHFIKDMRIAVEEADQRGAELPILKEVLGIYERMQEQGEGDLGTQAIIRAYR